MARRVGPVKVRRYSLEFKLKGREAQSVEGRRGPGRRRRARNSSVHVVAVAERGPRRRRGRVSVPKAVKTPPAGEMKRFQALQRAHALLHEEHALLKKLIRFTSARKPTSSRSSKKNGNGSV